MYTIVQKDCDNIAMLLYGTTEINTVQDSMAYIVAKALFDLFGESVFTDKSTLAKGCVSLLSKAVEGALTSNYDEAILILTDKESLSNLRTITDTKVYANRPVKESCRFVFRIQPTGPVKDYLLKDNKLTDDNIKTVVHTSEVVNDTTPEALVDGLKDIIIRYVPIPIRDELNNDYLAALYCFKDVYSLLQKQEIAFGTLGGTSALAGMATSGAAAYALGLLLPYSTPLLLGVGLIYLTFYAVSLPATLGYFSLGANALPLERISLLSVEEQQRITDKYLLGESVKSISKSTGYKPALIEFYLKKAGYDIK